MLSIKNYTPTFYEDTNKFIEEYKDKLGSLIGRKIDEIWTVHNALDGLFWADCPVIISIEGERLEFCSFRDSELAVTWNEIALEEKLDWYGSSELNLEWRKNAIEKIHHIIGQPIKKMEVIEMRVDSNEKSPWLLGLGFVVEKGFLAIFNAHDETGFSHSRNEQHLYKEI
ncbi:hypothetical protein [Halalkalibacter hemicellulosilyticus]|uniref:Uncharacterized protein n=1 Tax=Halalkalibacter hemicellulosilyticusJCM 9152 TaxID=1236971 RepID=W4QBD5_9BACI|nr:hypothetical protein [Halalkalibacter hemicellulosilyticus]GAE29325.1 hypothetical protein JCM9152_675 [Halalkalibacter hemicellulosilyticusJCM 9152]